MGIVNILQEWFLGGINPLLNQEKLCPSTNFSHSCFNKLSYIHSEVACLDWAKILLDLTYQFIEHTEDEKGAFPGTIPKLQFVEAAVAEVGGGTKFFLVEEWIDTSKEPFLK